MNEKKYTISVVIPIYNTECYLDHTIRSILMQSLNFEEHIQLILVNDCSTDRSGDICKEYKQKYPQNIVYIDFEHNRGVSAARNEGMKYATGKYITFFDSDDLWSINGFERAIEFLEANSENIDLVSCDIEYFDTKSEPHFLNQNLQKDEIVDVKKDYSRIRSICSTCIFKSEIAKQCTFNENQKCWEDTVFLNQIMMRKQSYGMLASDVKYYYRIRRENTSASQSYGKSKEYFFHEFNQFFNGIYQESIKQHGCFVPIAQYISAYALSCRFKERISILNEFELKEYKQILFDIIQYIDEKYLLEACNVDKFTQKAMVAFKHGVDFREDMLLLKNVEAQKQSLQQRLNRTTMNYNILKKWFLLSSQGKSITEYFYDNNYKKIAIYGMSDLGQYLLNELEKSNIEVLYAVDRRAGQLSAEIKLFTMEDELPNADVVVVTAAYFFNEIAEALQDKVECPIISIEDIVYSIGEIKEKV